MNIVSKPDSVNPVLAVARASPIHATANTPGVL